ncbi:uncharacterized protein [Epargyreus clarus]|uniref:uncharacterized protein isoform X2 n=1 Tax=Epargyreus clarus TaxID=520877 RepID=UPI003C2EA539
MDEELLSVKAVKPFRNTHNKFETINCKFQPKDQFFEPLTTKNAVKFLLEGNLKYRVCRYCLNVASRLSELDEIFEVGRKGAIYKVTLRDMIATVHPFKVINDPNFPDKICGTCVESTISAYLFSQQCERAERALRNCFEDIYEKFEKLDPLERGRKRGRQKAHPNTNVLYAEHELVTDYAEPIINIINLGSTTLENVGEINELECPKCWQVLPNVEALLNHDNLHPKNMWFNCKLCGQSFVKQRHYKRHIKDVHQHGTIIPERTTTNFKCNECGFMSSSVSQHLQHMEKHKFKTTFEHLVNRRMNQMCAMCLEKGTCMIHLNESIHLSGGYPGLNNEQSIYNIVSSTIPEMTLHNYTGTHICDKCLDHAISSYVFVNKIRHVRSRLFTCVSLMLDQLNNICDYDKNVMVEISQETILPLVKDELDVNENEDDETKFEVDVLEDEFRIKSTSSSGEESDVRSDVSDNKYDVSEVSYTKYNILMSDDENEEETNDISKSDEENGTESNNTVKDDLEDAIEDNPAKKVTKTYVNRKLLNGYQSFMSLEDDSLNDVCEFLTFKKKRKTYRRSYKCKFTCPYCNKHFISDYFLKKHVLKHAISKVDCKRCGMQFQSKFYLYEHIKMIHLMKESCYSTCKICGRMFNNTKKMKMHERSHCTKECQLCDKYFISQKHYDLHMQRHAIKLNMIKNWRIQTCSFCEKECANENELSLHVNKIHLQIKPYSCDMCDRLFYTEYDLKNHKKVHNLLSEESCEFCNKSLKCRKNLVIHVRKHLGTKPHICQVCRQSFYSENRMKRHMVIYHGGRFCCRLCKMVMATKSELKTHISIEHNAM